MVEYNIPIVQMNEGNDAGSVDAIGIFVFHRAYVYLQERMIDMKEKMIDWHEAFLSEAFCRAKSNRLRFVIPVLGLFTVAFLLLFTVQSYGKAIGQIPVIGYIDVGFLMVMSLFPLTGILGIAFTRYTEKYVYPYENELIIRYGTPEDICLLKSEEDEPEDEIMGNALPVS